MHVFVWLDASRYFFSPVISSPFRYLWCFRSFVFVVALLLLSFVIFASDIILHSTRCCTHGKLVLKKRAFCCLCELYTCAREDTLFEQYTMPRSGPRANPKSLFLISSSGALLPNFVASLNSSLATQFRHEKHMRQFRDSSDLPQCRHLLW